MDFQKKFKILQEETTLSQKVLAEKMNISRNAISLYLAGKRLPDYATTKKLLDYGVSPLFLFYDGFDKPFDDAYDAFLDLNKNIETERLVTHLDNLSKDYVSLNDAIDILGTVGAKNFLSKISDIFNIGEKKITSFLFYFFEYINSKKDLLDNNYSLEMFIQILEDYSFEHMKEDRYIFKLTEAEKKDLILWAKENLDNVAVFDIITNTPKIIDSLKGRVS